MDRKETIMLQLLKKTLKHSVIYSFGNIAAKLIGIVLLPLYTSHITLKDYGVLGIVEVTILIMSQVLMLGQNQAYMRFYDSEEYKENRKELLFSSSLLLLSVGLVLNTGGTVLLSSFIHDAQMLLYLRLAFIVIGLRMLTTLFLSVLRSQERSSIFVISNVLKLTVTLSFNIYFVAFIKLGVTGILYSMVIGDAVLFVILLPVVAKSMKAIFLSAPVKASMLFGLPLVINSLAGMILNMGDRYVLKILVDYREVGLYNLGYKIAGVLNMVFIQSFSLSVLPIAYKIFGHKGDKRFYSKIMTYIVFILLWAGLGMAVFSREIVHLFARSSDYWPAYRVVPLIILAYIFSGARSVVNIGLLLQKKTSALATVTVCAAVLNIVLNFILVPKFKMFGAAWATIISFVLLYIVTLVLSNRGYHISYEYKKLIIMLFVGLLLFAAAGYANFATVYNLIFKALLVLIFPAVLFILKFYEPIEIERIKGILKRSM
ncbi:oligosaccharide flippase family protein [bacterium]|nr:oligosaccharide flippase family protein [bacterium]